MDVGAGDVDQDGVLDNVWLDLNEDGWADPVYQPTYFSYSNDGISFVIPQPQIDYGSASESAMALNNMINQGLATGAFTVLPTASSGYPTWTDPGGDEDSDGWVDAADHTPYEFNTGNPAPGYGG